MLLIFALGLLVGFFARPFVIDPDSTEAHWKKLRKVLAFPEDQKNHRFDPVTGLGYLENPPDPIPSLTVLASRGVLRHMTILLPEVPSDREHSRHWMEFCISTPGIIWATGNPTYPDLQISGEPPLLINIWFEKSALPEVKRLIEELHALGGEPGGAANGSQPFRSWCNPNVIGGWLPSLTFVVRDDMKKLAIPIILIAVVAVVCVIVLLRQNSLISPSVLGEHFVPHLITDEAWRRSIAEDPTAHGYSGYGILQKRGSDVAIEEGLRDLRSDDACVWMNAASYLGSRGRKEAIPYLIKALRHTAWRSDEERVRILQNLSGETFGNSFDAWYEWYAAWDDAVELDWESSLGHAPRLHTSNREQDAGPNRRPAP